MDFTSNGGVDFALVCEALSLQVDHASDHGCVGPIAARRLGAFGLRHVVALPAEERLVGLDRAGERQSRAVVEPLRMRCILKPMRTTLAYFSP